MLKALVRDNLLPYVNRVMGLAGIRIVSEGHPTRDFQAFLSHVRRLGVQFHTVIDVGVAFGTPSLYKSCPGAKFFLVEPVPSAKGQLCTLADTLDAQVFHVAAGAADGEMPFYVHADTSGSSAYRQWEGALLDGEEVKVPVRRLDTLIPRPLRRPALLKIDTQGAELEVLAGATVLLDEVDLVIIETSFHEFRKGAPEFHHVVQRMSELGWVCYEILEGHYRALDGALAQVDLAFVKPESPLRAHKGFFTPEQAERYAKV